MTPPTEEQITVAARAMIVKKLHKQEIYPLEGTDILEDVPAELKEEFMDLAEAALTAVNEMTYFITPTVDILKK